MSINLTDKIAKPPHGSLTEAPVCVVPIIRPPDDLDGPYRGCGNSGLTNFPYRLGRTGVVATTAPVHAGGDVDSDTFDSKVRCTSQRDSCSLGVATLKAIPGAIPGRQHLLAFNPRGFGGECGLVGLGIASRRSSEQPRHFLATPTPVRGVACDAPDELGMAVDVWL